MYMVMCVYGFFVADIAIFKLFVIISFFHEKIGTLLECLFYVMMNILHSDLLFFSKHNFV